MPSEHTCGLRPRALRKGDKIGVVGLASRADEVALAAGCEALRRELGCEVVRADLPADGDFAGVAGTRAAALMDLWQRDDIGAIVCTRGGYGSNYLLPLLDFDAMRAAPKALVGCSDITSLLLGLDRSGIVCFHGPMAAGDFARGRIDVVSFKAALCGRGLALRFAATDGVCALREDEAEGALTGGCLSIVVTTLGTPWEIETRDRILFLEDVNERPYRVDRMLMHLLLAGKFEGVRGVIFGTMPGCQSREGEEPLPEMILRILGPLGVPIVCGFPSGHVESGSITLPFGVPAQLAATEGAVTLQVEPATILMDSH